MKSKITGTLPTVKIFDTTKTGIIEPDQDRYANGWQYQDKAFCEYFNYFWNETSTSLTQMNPFVQNLSAEIDNLVVYMKTVGMTDSEFDIAENNWFGKVGQWLKKKIDEEATAREQAVTNASNTLTGKITDLDTKFTNQIKAESDARSQAITSLESKLTKSISDLNTTLTGKITAETTARTQAINKEIQDRTTADNNLQTAINNLNNKLGDFTNTGEILVTSDSVLKVLKGAYLSLENFENTAIFSLYQNLLGTGMTVRIIDADNKSYEITLGNEPNPYVYIFYNIRKYLQINITGTKKIAYIQSYVQADGKGNTFRGLYTRSIESTISTPYSILIYIFKGVD